MTTTDAAKELREAARDFVSREEAVSHMHRRPRRDHLCRPEWDCGGCDAWRALDRLKAALAAAEEQAKEPETWKHGNFCPCGEFPPCMHPWDHCICEPEIEPSVTVEHEPETDDCVCHDGSFCNAICKTGRHHDDCQRDGLR